MITEYVELAMRKAKYARISGENAFFGKIPGFKGLWAGGETKGMCELELRERLEEWIVLSLRMNMSLPVLGGVTLNKTLSPVKMDVIHA